MKWIVGLHSMINPIKTSSWPSEKRYSPNKNSTPYGCAPGILWLILKFARLCHPYDSSMHLAVTSRLRNDLYCVEWDVKLYYTIPLAVTSRNSTFFCIWTLTFSSNWKIRSTDVSTLMMMTLLRRQIRDPKLLQTASTTTTTTTRRRKNRPGSSGA